MLALSKRGRAPVLLELRLDGTVLHAHVVRPTERFHALQRVSAKNVLRNFAGHRRWDGDGRPADQAWDVVVHEETQGAAVSEARAAATNGDSVQATDSTDPADEELGYRRSVARLDEVDLCVHFDALEGQLALQEVYLRAELRHRQRMVKALLCDRPQQGEHLAAVAGNDILDGDGRMLVLLAAVSTEVGEVDAEVLERLQREAHVAHLDDTLASAGLARF